MSHQSVKLPVTTELNMDLVKHMEEEEENSNQSGAERPALGPNVPELCSVLAFIRSSMVEMGGAASLQSLCSSSATT